MSVDGLDTVPMRFIIAAHGEPSGSSDAFCDPY